MSNVAETEVEMVAIPGDTPEEIASNYAQMSNDAYANSELRYSAYNSEMLPFAARYVRLLEVKDSYFMEVERVFYNPPVREREEAD